MGDTITGACVRARTQIGRRRSVSVQGLTAAAWPNSRGDAMGWVPHGPFALECAALAAPDPVLGPGRTETTQGAP